MQQISDVAMLLNCCADNMACCAAYPYVQLQASWHEQQGAHQRALLHTDLLLSDHVPATCTAEVLQGVMFKIAWVMQHLWLLTRLLWPL